MVAPSAHPPQAGGSPSGSPAGAGAPAVHDHELVRRSMAGDQQAFGELVRRHERAAFRVAMNLVGRREDALDLVQEAFLRVYKSLDRFDFEHEFSTWLYRIVTNQAIDHLRRRRPTASTASADPDEPELDLVDLTTPAPSAGLETGELADDVRACLEMLAPHFQTVLVLREMEGLPCNEIAKLVGATHVTVRWRLHRGRKLFQEEWERRLRLRERGLSSGSAATPDTNEPKEPR